MKRDYFEVLGVSRDTSTADIKKAYRKIAMKNHPDRNPGDAKAEEKFKEATEAYEVLANASKRKQYEQVGHNTGQNFGGGFNSEAAGDIFSDVFGEMFGGSRSRNRSRRGSDLQYNLEISLEEAVHGVIKTITIPIYKACSSCKSTGAKDGKLISCSHCNGSGNVEHSQGFFTVRQACPSCRGSGRVIANKCGSCNGHGRVRNNENLKVDLPAGVDHGDSIKHNGAGEAPANGVGSPGDLYVQILIKKHSTFKREGLSLFCIIPVNFVTAALGGAIEVPTISNVVKLKIPAETQTGKILKLRGKGIKAVNMHEQGDLYCEIKVETPINLNSKQKDLLEKFSLTLNKNHVPNQDTWIQKAKKFFEGKV